jgi:hypothetical protein
MIEKYCRRLSVGHARREGIREPYVIHMSGLNGKHKISFCVENGLWYVIDDDGRCAAKISKGYFDAWKVM